MPGNSRFYSFDKEHTQPDVKFKCKQNFTSKISVCLAVSNKGISTPYIGTTIDGYLYIEKFLPKLLTFITEHHQDDKYIFWADLTISHYVKTTIEWLNQQKIPFVPRCINPPNVPKARPIEDFWSILADKVYNGGWRVMNERKLVNKIKAQLKKIGLKLVQTRMKGAREKLRKIED
jgi:hypothetical protein